MKSNAAQAPNRKQRRAQASTSSKGKAAPSNEFARASTAFAAGDLAQAKALAEQLTVTTPESTDAWTLLSLIAERQGNMAQAIEIFQQATARLPKAADLYNNYAIILRKAERLKEAETALKQALALRPDYADAAWNLGNLYLQSGRMEEAEASYRTAMRTGTPQAKYPLQIAKILIAKAKFDEAEILFKQAITLARAENNKTLLTDALIQLGGLIIRLARRLEALPYLYEAITLGAGRATEIEFAHCVGRIRFSAARPELKPLLARAFREVWIAPADLVRVSAGMLFHEPAFAETLRSIDDPQLLTKDCAKTVVQDPLLLALMGATSACDPQLERLLTGLRRALLQTRPRDGAFDNFAIAMANQCFANEYAFAESFEEIKAVTTLDNAVTTALDSGAVIATLDLALLAAYRPLHSIRHAEKILAREWPTQLDVMLTRQLREPFRELELRKTISSITPIQDTTSEAVRGQYEENPYPRWTEAPSKRESYTLTSWLNAYFPLAPRSAHMPETVEVLVAGCGTGQQSVTSALRFAKTEILAVDLSMASLAYAVRKTQELGLTNVKYVQGDILELGVLDRTFDIVECGGVLHHLADPLKGWRVLTDLTRPGGYMIIALYSEIARRNLIPVRAYAKERGFGRSPEELRRFRAEIFSLDATNPVADLTARRDFYTLSMMRDLVFHVQEHRFTVPKLREAIASLGLEFCGFNVLPETLQEFRARFGGDANFLSFDQWDIFENEHPDTFLGMYQFLVRKPD